MAKVTYQYFDTEFEMDTTETKSEVIREAVRLAFPKNPHAYPVPIPERDGGGFRVFESAQGGEAERRLCGAGAVGPGRLADGSLFWPTEAA